MRGIWLRKATGGRSASWRMLVVAMVLAGTALPLGQPADAAPSTIGSYVALGDSFAAGPMIPVTDVASAGCQRSSSNYPSLLASRYQVSSFVDATCSGAAIRHMYQPQTVQGGVNPPQLDSLQPGTQLVTLQIGGNDIGYGELATNCVAVLPLGTPCQDRYLAGGVDQIGERVNATRSSVDGVLAEIRRRAPAAQVLLVNYQSLFPEGSQGCWPLMPYAPEDVPYLLAKQIQLNTVLRDSAAANGAVYVDTYTSSLGHDACQLLTHRWAEPVVLPLGGAPIHPNAAGMSAVAEQVASSITASVP